MSAAERQKILEAIAIVIAEHEKRQAAFEKRMEERFEQRFDQYVKSRDKIIGDMVKNCVEAATKK